VTEPCRVRAGWMIWMVDVEGIASSLNVFSDVAVYRAPVR
jgi:hypothetical protein